MISDPAVLGRTKWACSKLKHLGLRPKCDGGGQGYSVEEAQEAFMRQVGPLKSLETLNFDPDNE